MCSKAEIKSLDWLRDTNLEPETREAFNEMYQLIVDEDIKGDDIVMENQYWIGLTERFHKLIRMGAIDWNVPLQTSVDILKAYQSGNGPWLLELLDRVLESGQRTGGTIYLFKKKKKKGQTNRMSNVLRQVEERAWRTTLRILNPGNKDDTLSQQLRRSMATMLKRTQSYCLLLRSVVKETPAFVGYLLLVDSKWAMQDPSPEADHIYEKLSIKDIRNSVLETMSR